MHGEFLFVHIPGVADHVTHTWLIMALLALCGFLATRRMSVYPGRFQNVMEVVVPAANPAGITTLADLARPGVKVALCQAEVPCGSTAAKVFTNAHLTVTPVTLEADVKSTLAKVTLGEVDAAVVYVTDVLAAGSKVKGIQIPADVNASTAYPIAVLKGSANSTLAQAYVAYVLSAEGQKVLADAGFATP